MIGTKDDVTLHLAELRQRDEGWTFLPMDDPWSGLKGFVAFRNREDGTEDSRTYQWPVTGGILFPETRQVTLKELFDFIEETGTANLVLCDNPIRRMVGFARYEPERHRAVVVETPLTDVKRANGLTSEQREAFLKLRAEKQKQAQEEAITIIDLLGAVEDA